MQLYVTLEPEYVVGEVPHGKRVVIPITGGIFEGPQLKGTIIPGGADVIRRGDHVLVVTTAEGLNDITDILE